MSLFGSLFNKSPKPPEQIFDAEDLPKSEAELISDAEQGNPVSAFRLSYKYLFNDPTAESIGKAVQLLMLSSTKGYIPAYKRLANCYLFGRGVKPSRIMASTLYELAGDTASRKAVLQNSPGMHAGVAGHFCRKLRKSKNFTADLQKLAFEVGLYEKDQFIKQSKDPNEQFILTKIFESPELLDGITDW